nr:hypothetical protein [uncultured Niameybacter sp.]
MKRTKFIAGLVALSMILMGTGYAYWTDTLTIQTTATTGNLEVKFVDIAPYEQYGFGENEYTIFDGVDGVQLPITEDRDNDKTKGDDTGYNNLGNSILGDYADNTDSKGDQNRHAVTSEIGRVDTGNVKQGDKANEYVYDKNEVVTADKMTMTINDIYPGYAQFYRADIINTGTVAAKLAGVKVKVTMPEVNDTNDNAKLKDILGINVKILADNGEGNVLISDLFDGDDVFTVGEQDFVRLSALDTKYIPISKTDSNQFTIFVEDANESRLDAVCGIAMDPDEVGKYTSGKYEKQSDVLDALTQLSGAITVDVELGWDQFNAPANSAETKPGEGNETTGYGKGTVVKSGEKYYLQDKEEAQLFDAKSWEKIVVNNWNFDRQYHTGDYVMYWGKLYQAQKDNKRGAFPNLSSNWNQIQVVEIN